MDHQWLEKKREEFLNAINRARVEVDEAVLEFLDAIKRDAQNKEARQQRVAQTDAQKDDHPHQLTKHTSIDERDAQTKEARQQVRILLNLLGHACQCQAGQCHYRGCGNVKELLQHGMLCKVYPFVDCPLCKNKWHLLQLHSRYCRDTPCNVPCYRDLKERLTKLTRQADSQRMAAIIDEMRQRAAEDAGSSG